MRTNKLFASRKYRFNYDSQRIWLVFDFSMKNSTFFRFTCIIDALWTQYFFFLASGAGANCVWDAQRERSRQRGRQNKIAEDRVERSLQRYWERYLERKKTVGQLKTEKRYKQTMVKRGGRGRRVEKIHNLIRLFTWITKITHYFPHNVHKLNDCSTKITSFFYFNQRFAENELNNADFVIQQTNCHHEHSKAMFSYCST